MRKIVTAIEGILIMTGFTAGAMLDDVNYGDLCGIIFVASLVGFFIMYKLEENYEF